MGLFTTKNKSFGIILRLLDKYPNLTRKQIIEKTSLASRTVTYALKELERKNKIKRKPNFSDMRQNLFEKI